MGKTLITGFEKKLLKFFKGQLPLKESFWYFFIFGDFITSVPLMLLRSLFLTFHFFLVIKILYTVLSMIGVLISSFRYKKNKIWPYLARFFIFLQIFVALLGPEFILQQIYNLQ